MKFTVKLLAIPFRNPLLPSPWEEWECFSLDTPFFLVPLFNCPSFPISPAFLVACPEVSPCVGLSCVLLIMESCCYRCGPPIGIFHAVLSQVPLSAGNCCHSAVACQGICLGGLTTTGWLLPACQNMDGSPFPSTACFPATESWATAEAPQPPAQPLPWAAVARHSDCTRSSFSTYPKEVTKATDIRYPAFPPTLIRPPHISPERR